MFSDTLANIIRVSLDGTEPISLLPERKIGVSFTEVQEFRLLNQINFCDTSENIHFEQRNILIRTVLAYAQSKRKIYGRILQIRYTVRNYRVSLVQLTRNKLEKKAFHQPYSIQYYRLHSIR